MLIERQRKILSILIGLNGRHKTGNDLSVELNVSQKTIQSDIHLLKNLLNKNGAIIEAQAGLGYSLKITKEESFAYFIKEMCHAKSSITNFEDQYSRVFYSLKKLLLTNEYIQTDILANEVFISKSRFSSDLKIVREILAKYELEVVHRPRYGLRIFGSEMNKRTCLKRENIPIFLFDYFDETDTNNNSLLTKITDITTDSMVKYRYKTSDVLLQNLIMHIFIAVKRILASQCLEEFFSNEYFDISSDELKIAENIFYELSKYYSINYPKQEVYSLALNLLGKKNYNHPTLISDVIDELVITILEKIHHKTGLDLTYDLELRISLALHFTPLILRIQHNIHLANVLKDEIKQFFTLAYDVAVIAASVISKRYSVSLSEDEISYIAIYFNLSLQKYGIAQKPKHVLILSSSRRGDMLLMKYTLLRWFNEMISHIEVRNLNELNNTDLSNYDVIFTTTHSHPEVPPNAVKINYFLDESDRRRIGRALSGIHEPSEILSFFKECLFLPSLDASDKKDCIRKMCDYISSKEILPDDFFEMVIQREELGSTAFGNMIALPHPDGLVTNSTFVCTAILNKPIQWGNNPVWLVMLVSVEKNNENNLRDLFEVLSKVLADKDGVQTIIKTRTYTKFTEIIQKAYNQI